MGVKLAEMGYKIWNELGDQSGIAYSSMVLGQLKMRQGDYEKSRSFLSKACNFIDNWVISSIAHVLILLGETYFHRDEQNGLQFAGEFFEESMRMNRQLGLDYMLSWSINNLSVIELEKNNFQNSLALSIECLELVKGQISFQVPAILDTLGLANYY